MIDVFIAIRLEAAYQMLGKLTEVISKQFFLQLLGVAYIVTVVMGESDGQT